MLVAEAEAAAEHEVTEKQPHGDKDSSTAMEAQHLGTPLQPIGIGIAYEPFVPQSKDDLLEALKPRNKQQAQDKKFRTEAQHQKKFPFLMPAAFPGRDPPMTWFGG